MYFFLAVNFTLGSVLSPRYDSELEHFYPKTNLDEIIFIVVGGKKFEATWRILSKFPDTKLGKILFFYQIG